MLEIISLHTLSISFHEIKYQIFYFMEKKMKKFQKIVWKTVKIIKVSIGEFIEFFKNLL